MGNRKKRDVLATFNRALILALPFILMALGVAVLLIAFKASARQEDTVTRTDGVTRISAE
ncbi:MAG: hypothetical protein N2255_10315 [Kiritimatiellae bacterium]|nr:hypothetical protein [Kiritimatiellia bacterium]